MDSKGHPIAQLRKIATEFHHLRAEHQRKSVETRLRRQGEARLKELEEAFETRLMRWVHDTAEQERWRAHMHHGAELPADLIPDDEPPVFRGRSEAGAELLMRGVGDGDEVVVIIEDSVVDRRPKDHAIAESLYFDDTRFDEVFEVPREALEALMQYVDRGSQPPPWGWAAVLYGDGLIDQDFGLTARGQRFLKRRRHAERPGA